MAALTGKKPKDTYKDLLQVSNSNSGIDSTLRFVSDGEGTDSILKLSTTTVEVAGDITATGTVFVEGDTAAGDDAAIGYTSAEGIIITGQGSTNDITIKNDADAAVLVIPTGTTNVDIVGVATAATFEPDGDTSSGDNAAIGYTSAEGLIITGQGSTNDVTIKNDADADVITIATGTTNVDIVGDVTAATLNADGDTSASDNAAIGYTSAEGLIITGQGSTNDITVKNDADGEVFGVPTGTTGVTFKGVIRTDDATDSTSGSSGSIQTDGGIGAVKEIVTDATLQALGDTAASDKAAIGYTSAEGIIITGQGSTNDVTIKNDADADVITIATGTTNVDVVGDLTAGTVNADGDTAAGDDAAMGYTSAEGLILTGQGSTNDVTIKNDADADVITIPTGATNVTIAGDLTISGDDLFMGTNTSGAALIADGTNFNPVVISGDAAIATNGALTIADNAVSLAKMAGLARGKLIYGDSSGDPAALAVGSASNVLQTDGTDVSWSTVATAGVADNAITLAKMAGLVRGKIIYGDSSGDPAALTVGSNTQVLTSDGTDISWSTPSSAAISSYTNSGDNRIVTSVDSSTVNGEANLSFDGSVLAVTGNVTATGTVEPAGDTASGDDAAFGYTSVLGAIITGQGSTNDVTLVNDADATVLGIATGTTNVDVVGDLTASTLNADGDTAAGDDAAIGWTSAEGIIITGQGSTNDVTIKNDADADVITIPTGATNVTIAGDLTISGDDLFMGTNTSGAALIADGTNFNPVVISGDATIATNGALTVADNAISLAKMAGGTDGVIITYDASGDPVHVGPGSDGQVLTSTGAGSPPAFESASGGGAWTLIGTQVASTSASLTQTGLDTTYAAYAFSLDDVRGTADAVNLYFRLGDSGGIDDGASDYASFHQAQESGSFGGTYTETAAFIKVASNIGSLEAEGVGISGYIHMGTGATTVTFIQGMNTQYNAVSKIQCGSFFGLRRYPIDCTQIQFYMSTGNISRGRFSVWGISHA